MGDWENLPEIILAQIFSWLPTTDRLCLRQVCPSWAYASMRPEVWRTFVYAEEECLNLFFDANTIDRVVLDQVVGIYRGSSKNAGMQTFVDLIRDVGKHFRHVKLYYRGSDSHQVLNSLAQNCSNIVELKVQRLLPGVQVIRNHECACNQAIYTMLQQNRHLQMLDIRDLNNMSVAQHKEPLPFGAPHALSLRSLYFLQSFQGNNLSNLMYLVNLRELAIEPHVLSYSLLYHLAGNSLTDLHIVAASKRLAYYQEALQNWQWQEICKQGPNLRVHCHFGVGHEWTEKEVILKEAMPVKSMKYLKYRLLDYPVLSDLVCRYSGTLEEFIDISMSLSIYEVAQRNAAVEYNYAVNLRVFDLVRCCTRLQTLAVKEVLCSGTVLVMLFLNRNLNILLMEEQIKYSPVLPSSVTLSGEIHDLIVRGSVSREDFEAAVFKLTGKEWHFLLKSELYDTILQKYLTFV